MLMWGLIEKHSDPGDIVLDTFAGAATTLVAAKNSAALAASMVAGTVVETKHHATLADGVAGGMDQDSVTLALAIKTVDQVIT